MAHIVAAEAFAKLTVIATALLEASREISEVETTAAQGATPEQRALLVEAESLSLAMQAIAKQTALDEPNTFVALGGCVGTILAQCLENHAALLRIMRQQEQRTYDEVVAVSRPTGRMQ